MSLLRFKQISGSILTTASVSLNTITFTKGDGTTFSLLIDTGSGGTGGGGSGSTSPGGPNKSIQFNGNGAFSGSSNFTFDSASNSVVLTGSMYLAGTTPSIYFSGSGAASRLVWNDTDGTLDLGLKGGNVTLQIGQEQVIRVVNKTGANLLESEYKVARIRRVDEGGSQGQRLAIVLAQADNDANSVDTLGLVTENIDVNQEGFITNSGLVRNVNTTGTLQSETWADGDVLYLSPTTAGKLTKVKPQAPQHTVIMGYVVYAHINNGKIFVKVDNGYELDELHNVRINTSSLAPGDLLVRAINNGGVWENTKQLTGSYGLTGSMTFVSGGLTSSLFGTSSWAQSASNAISSSYALSSSYAANGGVTKIIAGTNISISPTNGLGDVTINSSGGGSADTTNLKSGSFGVTVDGQGSTITTGDAGYVLIPYNCTMSGWYMFGDQVGSIGIDLRKDTYDTFPAVQGDSICNSFFPTMSSAQKSSGSVAGWTTTTLSSGDIINFNVTSSSSVTRVNLIVNVIKS